MNSHQKSYRAGASVVYQMSFEYAAACPLNAPTRSDVILPSLSGAPEDPDFDLPAHSELANRRGEWAERRRHHALRRARPLFRLPNGSLPRILLDSVQEGSTWRVWRPTDPAWPAPADSGEVTTCYPGTLQFRSSAAAQPMCLAKHDIVSDGIRRFSRWRDCSRLVRLWQAAARDANGVRGVTRHSHESVNLRWESCLDRTSSLGSKIESPSESWVYHNTLQVYITKVTAHHGR